ncbi:MAG TPA: chromosome segregation protein SMC [Elusimicrobia bacterium]|nr:chromosome segregation protein SMC [Elusimicrobiota bacterium]
MHLKTIEINGFKSFADRTVLNFGEGITAIVGPNGCGKTNITDAIKWVLGEQSAKSLRGTKMEDVIFSGTASRKQTSVSEITLTFDNSKNVLPIDYSEVSVTRRLFRTGESEYQLNKTPVRLRDIKDLFLDTGIGTESYSIMEQGKIDFILQSKPAERRYIFEEVAGVSKYKSKREEALRKLEKVGQDMLRLNDILSELESQKSKLDTQARKARQYQKYLDELKNYEVNSLVQKYQQVKETNSVKLKELTEMNEKLSNVSVEIDKLDAKYSELKITLASKEDELISKRTEANKIDSSIAILNERILSAETAKKESIIRKDEAKQEIEQGQTDLNDYAAELAGAKKELEEAEIVVSTASEILAKKTEQKNKLNSEITKTNSDIENLRSVIFKCATELSELHNKKTSIDLFLKEINNRIEKQKTQEQETLTKKSEQEKIAGAIKEKITVINLTLEEKKKKAENLSAKINQLRSDIEKNQNELLSKKELGAQFTARMEAMSRNSNYELNSRIKETFKGRVHRTVGDIITVSDENLSVVQSALGEKSDYIVVDTENTAIEIINWLKNGNYGWANFLIMSEIERMQIPQSQVFSGKKISDLANCDSQFRKIMDFLLDDATLKNENIYSRGIICGGTVHSTNRLRGSLETSAEINRLKNETAIINGEIGELTELIKNEQGEIASTGTELNDTTVSVETEKNELMQIMAELTSAEESLKTSVNYLTILSAEYENLNNQKIEKESEIIAITDKISKCSTQENSAKTGFTDADIQMKKLQAELEKLEGDFTNVQIDFSVKSSQMENIREKIKSADTTLQLTSAKIEKSKKYFNDSADKIAAMEKIISDSTAEINKIVVSKDTVDDVLRNIEKERDEIKNSIIELENNLRTHRTHQNTIQEETRTLERAVSSTASEIRQIENRIKEEKGISIEDAVNNYKVVAMEQDEVEKLKKKIETLGAVNLAAPEEYEQLEQRYNFLTKQKEDLEKAREDLHNAINKINITTRQNFQKTFTVVRENFRNIFNQLFEGGEADLLLTDEGNLLETGIDIIAQPPGKKLQHISLLSGGERTLTAIAILFAIYLVKPAPFCILDEIDGQLDEANVLRFTRMLKEFAKISQFFVITHNKRTMEAANVLYGVTMEELGISKIISVHLEGEKVPEERLRQ